MPNTAKIATAKLSDRHEPQLGALVTAPKAGAAVLTPAGLQRKQDLTRRRIFVVLLNVATLAVIACAVAAALGAGPDGSWSIANFTLIDGALFACVMLSAPWTVLGFWNAAIGLWLLRGSKDPIAATAPHLKDVHALPPLHERVALTLFIRDEDPARAFERVAAMRESLDATGAGDRFDVYILSDTSDAHVAQQEAELFKRNRAALDGLGKAVYRRRVDNTGFKAGNMRDFIDRWGENYEFMIPLDADSVMSGEAMVSLARVAQAYPRLGILQSLVVGAPAQSPFARIFQFGMRHGMRSFTMGAAWWQGDCGPFWGHNAVVRIKPFRDHCDLPVLPGEAPLGGHILSHDQLEAALMRRAGYEVRVAPVESESWEENPVTSLDFIKREQRWCNGNMQYWPLLNMPNLRATSRFQLFQAIMMYLGSPAWMLLTLLSAVKVFEGDAGYIDPTLAIGLFATMFIMSLSPKIAGVLDVVFERGGVARYGGALRFLNSVLIETLFSMLLAPAVAFQLTVFLLGLPFGRKIGWKGQIRDAYGLEWRTAIKALWAPTLFGLGVGAAIAYANPGLLPWAAPVLLGLALSIPLTVISASPALGEALKRMGVAQIPEETQPAAMLEKVEQTQIHNVPASQSRDYA